MSSAERPEGSTLPDQSQACGPAHDSPVEVNPTELRCDSKILHGKILEGVVEVSCRSARCGKTAGVTVLHRFNLTTGELLDTRVFARPSEVKHNHERSCPSNSIRTA